MASLSEKLHEPLEFGFYFQVYLVTGGNVRWTGDYNVNGENQTDTTELLVQGAAQWIQVGALPTPRHSITGVSFNNKIVVAGDNAHRIAAPPPQSMLFNI